MIKFIASDLDGTLLDGEHKLPEETFSFIERLYEKGILFAPASGRQYANLKKLFKPVADKVVFIAENGALVKFRDETIFSLPIEREHIRGAIEVAKKTEWAIPVLCCEKNAYTDSKEQPFYAVTRAAYTNLKKVKALEEVIGKENCCKIAVFDRTAKADIHAEEICKQLPHLRTVVSGREWLDVSAPDVHKGVAMIQIRKALSLKKEECMAFGDHMNDYEMLLECGYPYVTANAYPPLKEKIPNVVPSNAEKGVFQRLEQLLREY